MSLNQSHNNKSTTTTTTKKNGKARQKVLQQQQNTKLDLLLQHPRTSVTVLPPFRSDCDCVVVMRVTPYTPDDDDSVSQHSMDAGGSTNNALMVVIRQPFEITRQDPTDLQPVSSLPRNPQPDFSPFKDKTDDRPLELDPTSTDNWLSMTRDFDVSIHSPTQSPPAVPSLNPAPQPDLSRFKDETDDEPLEFDPTSTSNWLPMTGPPRNLPTLNSTLASQEDRMKHFFEGED